ncbi:MAG: CARDB domain-containing protein [Acidobacteriota bacterium]
MSEGDATPTAAWQSGLYPRLDLTARLGLDLELALGDGRDRVVPGDTVTYTLTVTNHGDRDAAGVTLTDTLPAQTTVVAASDSGTAAAGTVTWPPFSLAEGGSAVRLVTVRLATSFPAGIAALVNRATAGGAAANGIDPTPANNTAQDSDVLDAAPDLTVEVSDGRTEVLPGERLETVVTVRNRGAQGAAGVRLTVALPADVILFVASDSGAESGTMVTWPLFDLAAGASVTRTLSLQVKASLPASLTELATTAEVADDGANGADVTPADNRATDHTAVIRKPDLAVPSVDTSQTHLDLQTLALTGDLLVRLENRGTFDTGVPFEVTVFEDTNGDGAWTAGTDNLLGRQTYGAALAAGQNVPFVVPVAGTVAFRGSRLLAFADSAGAVAELDETNNVGGTGSACQAVPASEQFHPELEMVWPRPGIVEPNVVDSSSSPVVVNLTDDNGDGKIDGKDVPDIVFTTANVDPPFGVYVPTFLRAIRGDTGEAIFDVQEFYDGAFFYPFTLTTVAAGDIDGDGLPEIVVATLRVRPPFGPSNVLQVYEHDGRRKWRSAEYSTHPQGGFTNRDNPYIADIDRDGVPEIIVGANVFNNNGTLRWKGTGGQGYQSNFNNQGGASGAISIVANLDLLGDPEIVTGNTAYHSDGSVSWQVPLGDGYPAIGNFDADPFPEIVVVSKGTIRLHEHDGTLKWGPFNLPGSKPVAGGTPTVADFDGDGKPEIGVASSDFYAVYETDGSVKWQRPTQDFSSGMTGSTVFDFDGNGKFEVVYRDERFLRVYRGADGTVLFSTPVPSSTLNEEPVVADVDKDGNAEILVTADHGSNETGIPGNASNAGLRVYGDADDNWVGTRGIWNQHAYSVDNVNDDATIPRDPAWGWLIHNTYRSQIAPPGTAFAAPDLTASRGRVDVTDFPRSLRFTVRVGNGGSSIVGPGVPVAFYSGDPKAGGTLIATAALNALEPGRFQDVSATWVAPPDHPATIWIVADDDGSVSSAHGGRERECDETNNVYAFAYDLAEVGLFLQKSDGRPSLRLGDTTTYTLTVSNYFPGPAAGVLLTDTLPAHAAFVAASDGGTAADGIVSWPAFDLAAGARATRTVTVRADATVPPEVTTLTDTAVVTGGGRPDSTPGNNTATDTDDLLSFRADAGGPYSGGEGEGIALDASASSDPGSQIVRYEWDLDGDGAYDDATGVHATVTFPDQGTFTMGLRAVDAAGRADTATATVAVSNRPPVVDAGADRGVPEGDRLTLTVPFTDPGSADTHTAFIDWGQGTVEAVPVSGTGSARSVSGTHIYPDDGVFDVRACVTDDDGDAGCDTVRVTVANQNPVVQGAGAFDLRAWRPEDYASCYDGPPDWQVAADGASVTQAANSRPALLYSNFLAVGSRIEATVRASSAASPDGDAFGFALGFQPGDATAPAADFLLVDWRRQDQTFNFGCGGPGTARKGFAVSRVQGAAADAELWAHDRRHCNGDSNGVTELARAAHLGSAPWAFDTDYRIALESTPGRLRVYVNDTLEIDLPGTFTTGRLAFYAYSQVQVTFRGVALQTIVADEGRPVEGRAGFTDAGALDTHTGTLDWGDGSAPSAATISTLQGFRFASGTHSYPDDGSFSLRACVTDDDGGTGCDDVPVLVRNLPPEVHAGDKVLADPGQAVSLAPATFTDAGVRDTHTATIDWGDGTVQAGSVAESNGAGTVSGSHVYAGNGTFVVTVCVTDNGGAQGCDSLQVNAVLDLAVTKTSDAPDVIQPGQTLHYSLTVANHGTLAAAGVQVVDPLPAYTSYVSASAGGKYDPQTDTLTWTVGTLKPGETVTLTATLEADHVLPVGAVIANHATVHDDGSQGPNVRPGDTGDDTGGTTAGTPSDLVIPALDKSGVVFDRATLALDGALGVTVTNQGGLDVTHPFAVTVFVDGDGDRAFNPAVDAVLGRADAASPLAAGQSVALSIPVSGTARFRDDLLWAFADSEGVVAEVDETNNLRNTGQACRVAEPPRSRTYTLDADFDQGLLLNADHDAPHHDELRVSKVTEPFPFVWVAKSGRNTAVKIDAVTGQILGEYLTAPAGRAADPSRTTVDLDGNVWVTNRAEASGGKGSVVHIGLKEAFQCVDRNGNGVIDTSTGLGDIRPWPNTGGADDNGGVSTAADECILLYVRVDGTAARTVAITPDKNLWVGGFGNAVHNLLDGTTGRILDTIRPPCGGYGGLVDAQGVLWSARNLLRYDPATGEMTCLAVSNSYGLALDRQGNVWNSQWTDNTITKMRPDGSVIDVFPTGGGSSRGVAVTADDNIWIANSGSNTVTRLSNDGDLLATVPVGVTPTGVAVDALGKIWVTNLGSDNAMRIDPATNKVDLTVFLGAGAGPYNYSDMTGAVSLGRTAPQGRWTVIHDGGQAGTPWGRVRWTSWQPPGATVTVRARAADSVAALGGQSWAPVENGRESGLPAGRYLQAEVTLTPSPAGETPIVYDVTVETRSGLPDLTASVLRVTHKPSSIEVAVRVGNGGDAGTPAGVPVALYDGDPAAGGTRIGLFTDLFPLAPGASQDVTFVWASPPAGTHTLYAVANDQGPMAECDRANNTDTVVVVPAPDLVIPAIDRSGAVTDLQTLAVTGSLAVTIRNQGNASVTAPFQVSLFQDLDRDGRFTAGSDVVLGTAGHTGSLAPGQADVLAVPVAGTLRFRDDLLWAFADSAGAVAELDEENNLNQTGASCDFHPPVGSFSPQVEWQWTGSQVLPASNQVMMTPAVIDLTGDGVPEVVFTTYEGANYNTDGHLRAVDGRTGAALFTVTDPSLDVRGAGSVAVGDIDLDGRPEILAVAESGDRLLAFENDGRFKWRSGEIPGGVNWGGAALADLDRDGTPEIVVGATVLDHDGTRRWVGGFGRGDNTNLGPLSLVADLDLSGQPEVIAGNTAYRSDGTVLWRRSDLGDGFNAVGNFDADPFPEIVLVTNGSLYLLNHDGSTAWGAVPIPAGGRCGAPTVADVDGDGQPEIGVAGNSRYVVFETNGTVKWQAVTQDGSSQVTGSSVFDFEGDGRAEVVYGDERFLRIYRGSDGTVLYQLAKSSGTTYELPVVADVDADGNTEIVAVANTLAGFGPQNGVFVIGDAADSWVPTRKLWNQHTYHVANVNDDGSIPRREEPSWRTHNTYRLNLRTDGDPLAAPDLTASRITIDLSNPAVEVRLGARVGNGGRLAVPAGVPVAFYNGDPAAGGTLLGTVATSRSLEPGDFEDVGFIWRGAAPGPYTVFVVVDPVAAGRGKVSECDEANNRHSFAFTVPAVPDLTLAKDDGRATAVPGQTVTYTLTVTNVGPRNASGVRLTDILPPQTTFVSAGDGGAQAGGTVTWPAFDLPAGAVATRTLTVRLARTLPAGTTAITNQASVTDDGSVGPDPTAANNSAVDTDSLLHAPEAADDSLTTAEDTPAAIAVLANDSDDDGDRLTVESATPPEHGTVEIGADNRVTYTPALNFNGADLFTYTVSDGTGGLDTATVTVTVTPVNDRPVAVDDNAFTDQETPVVIAPLANDSDADGDPLTYMTPPQPFGGTLAVNPDGTVTYTPAPGFFGADVFLYTVTDGQGGTATATIRVGVNLIDGTPPLVTIAGVPDGCANHTVTPEASAYDQNLEEFLITLNGAPFVSGTPVTAEGSYLLVATAIDEANNRTVQEARFTIDTTQPAVAVTGVPSGCVATPVTPVVAVTDTHPGTTALTLNGTGFTSGTTLTDDGDYTLAVLASDACGNQRDETRSWIIDSRPPAVEIRGVIDGQIGNADVVPTITVIDPHLGPVTVLLDGAPFTSGSTVGTEGDHTLAVTAVDACGNQAAPTLTFTIDKTAPVLSISGVLDGGCGNADVVPHVTAADAHLAGLTVTLDGAPFTEGSTVTAEGTHTLEATARDQAGNVATSVLTFTIDRTPPAITVAGVTDGALTNVSVTPVVDVADIHLGTVATTLDGTPFASGTAVFTEGDHTLAVTAADTCGNRSTSTVRFTVDRTPPIVTVGGLPGACVSSNVTPTFSAADDHPGSVTATLNGAPFASGTTVTGEGDFTLVVTATDAAGNGSTVTRSFSIDRTAPAVTIRGVAEGACVNAAVTPVFESTDPHPGSLAATLNGSPFTSGAVVSADGDYLLRITAVDACGNQATAERRWTIDQTPPDLTVSGVTDGQTTAGPVTPAFAATDLHLGPVTATLNGAPFVSGTPVSAPGSHTLLVTAADTCGNQVTRTVRFTIASGTCELYPIALWVASLADRQPGDQIVDIFNGTRPGNFGWLTWMGDNDVPALIASLTPPGNSSTYVNPHAPTDPTISIGDWVQGKPGVSNASDVRKALDNLETRDIVVPVWDATEGQGANVNYRVMGFARVRLLDYRLPSQNRITVRFLGFVSCGG